MIATLSGPVQYVGRDHLVVAVGGIGLRVFVPKTVLEDTPGSVFLHTHMIVRETELTLYGFSAQDDLRLFLQLLDVPKVGPKLALGILSTLSPELLRSAVLQDEPVILQRVPGIGKRSAERILFALRGKLDTEGASTVGLFSDVDADVIEALTSLGFSIVEAQSALQKLPRDVRDVNERISLALQQLDQG